MNRRRFLKAGGSLGALLPLSGWKTENINVNRPLVLSTWNEGIAANEAAWKVLQAGGRALDAVEAGVMVTEASRNCCVGLGANPDRDGFVTLDASIMDEHGNCGSVACLERIKHPISVARKVMEDTPHVMLAGVGAQRFALSKGFPLESGSLSPDAQHAYDEWLKKSNYRPIANIENSGISMAPPSRLPDGSLNHDTIGMIAIDASGNLSGSCTTSGMGFKMRGRIGDSPVIGAGLYVDNEAGAAVSTGLGEEVIKSCGTHLVVEFMRQGAEPLEACVRAVDRILQRIRKNGALTDDLQVGFLAIRKDGTFGGYAVRKGFTYAVYDRGKGNRLLASDYSIKA